MRIDKFLWCVRFYKTRAIATEECKKNKILLGEQTIMPSKEVIPGETYIIKKNQIEYKIQVIQIPSNRVGAKLVSLYIKDLTDPQQLELLKNRMQVQSYYREKGLGRPTKKDRRDLDDYTLSWEDEDE